MKGDRVEIAVDAGRYARTDELTAGRSRSSSGAASTSIEVTRGGTAVRTARLAARMLALAEHPATDTPQDDELPLRVA